MPESMPEQMPDRMPDRFSKYMPERECQNIYVYTHYYTLPDGVSKTISEKYFSVGITQRK